ncbi:MAG: hypothetical protein JWQ98_703 [Chlorobi bacterium]|nr:hypothetical protein [Chlorobiota bacterium]
MEQNGLYGATILTGLAAIGSFMYDCEVLFLMGILLASLLGVAMGAIYGLMVLGERLSSEQQPTTLIAIKAETSISRQ